MGGSHVTFMADEALEHADFVARGEGGEQLMLELIDALDGERSFDDINGLSFRARRPGGAQRVARAQCTMLDELPFPDLSLIHGYDDIRPRRS